jgi:hypothetical protein
VRARPQRLADEPGVALGGRDDRGPKEVSLGSRPTLEVLPNIVGTPSKSVHPEFEGCWDQSLSPPLPQRHPGDSQKASNLGGRQELVKVGCLARGTLHCRPFQAPDQGRPPRPSVPLGPCSIEYQTCASATHSNGWARRPSCSNALILGASRKWGLFNAENRLPPVLIVENQPEEACTDTTRRQSWSAHHRDKLQGPRRLAIVLGGRWSSKGRR